MYGCLISRIGVPHGAIDNYDVVLIIGFGSAIPKVRCQDSTFNSKPDPSNPNLINSVDPRNNGPSEYIGPRYR
jgi:hypothetical protein